jgi:hypothetical protein
LEITVCVPHSVVTLIEYKRQYWLTNARMVRYQSMLYENPQMKLEVAQTLNLATILLGTRHDPGLGIMEFAQPLHIGVCTASSTIISPVPGVLTFVLTSP